MAHGFYSAQSLWKNGHYIGGKRAWTITLPGKNKYYWRHRPLTGKLVSFGPCDCVYVRKRVGTETTGHQKYSIEKYKRQWYLSFLVTIWFLNNFNLDNTVRTLVSVYRVHANKYWVKNLLLRRIRLHWGEVKKYMASKFGVEIEELVKKQMEITKMAMEKGNQNPAYLSIANTSNMNLLRVVAEVENRPATDKTLKSTGQQILDAIRDKQRQPTEAIVDDSAGEAGISPGAVEAV